MAVGLPALGFALGPVFEKAFAPLIADGYLQVAYGGPEVGAYFQITRPVRVMMIAPPG